MANSTLIDLPTEPAPTIDDWLYIVDNSGPTPVSKKITLGQIRDLLGQAGIPFGTPAPISVSTTTLDDYREGTFTPVLCGNGGAPAGQTYSVQTGRFVKIGRLVVATANLYLSAKGTMPGTRAVVEGFPYKNSNSGRQHASVACSLWVLNPASQITILGAIIQWGETRVDLLGNYPTCQPSRCYDNIPIAAITDQSLLALTATYETDE